MKNKYDFSGKTVTVTGGGSGMGQASAMLFSRHGARVVIGDININGAEETASMIRGEGGEAVAVKVDVSVEEDVSRFVEVAIDQFGRLDCAVNVAGLILTEGSIADCELDVWDRLISVNLTGTFLCMKYQARRMSDKGGAIVNFSSSGGLIGSAGQAGYVSSKHGVLGLTKSAARDFGPRGIRVNAICPGFIRTPMTEATFGDSLDAVGRKFSPLDRMAGPEEVADAALWLCSDAASFVTGSTIVVDGGMLCGVTLDL